MMMRVLPLPLLYLLLAVLCTATLTHADSSDSEKLIRAVVDWVVARGGTFNSKLDFRRIDPNDASSPFGLFAIDDIPDDEVLLVIPRDCLITAGDDDDDDDDYEALWCPTVRNLVRELKLGNDSEFAPYINYLLSQSHGQLPSAWSPEGQTLLLELVAQNDGDYSNDLKPSELCGWITDEWHTSCHGSTDPVEENAAALLIQRGWDDIMIPVYDMMNHRNGRWLNTKSNSVHDLSSPIQVRASRDIKAGDEIFTSYIFCEDCGSKATGYGTPEMLRDYGFVEHYPQLWFFGGRMSFELDEELDENGTETGKVLVNWLGEPTPGLTQIRNFMDKLDRLSRFAEIELEYYPDSAIPKNEFDVIVEYYEATTNAMNLALAYLGVNYSENKCGTGNDFSCSLATRYDGLGFKPDDIDYAIYTCDTEVSMSYQNFDTLEAMESHYQKISFNINPSNSNVCFDIHNTIQICGSYRPQYHEMVTHYTARFMPDIKRVLFVGGGDSMLLHEIIKYKSLEIVVGLELDQYITRLSYKHFGTQPHFDNPKVQWWYGDASKSLLMLPEDYFGSFDMVLVDLSETVMSLLVTGELDIMAALSLLLKPDGIFVKNELYLEQMAEIFDYSIQIHYPGVPVICSQCLIMGSNKVDFLYQPLTEHDLNADNLYIQPLSKIEDENEYIHDYRRNSTAKHLCKDGDEPEPEPVEQTSSPGIMMVIETEDVNVNLQDYGKILDIIVAALEGEGLEKVSTAASETDKGAALFVVLREGYVMARTYPEHKYCAIDLHLWSSFEKHDAAKTALVKALGSGTPSAYRIVAGGMFGVSTWKDDEKKRGPRVTETCERKVDTPRDQSMEKSVAGTILEESLKFMQGYDQTVVVLCGDKTEGCQSLDILSKAGFTDVVPLWPWWPCSGIADVNEFQEGAFDRMISCEKDVRRTLLATVSPDKKIRSIIIDPSASLPFARVAYKVLQAKKSRLVMEDLFAVALVFNESESWRRNFVERLRTELILYDTNFRTEVLFNSTDSSFEMDVFSSGDELFIRHLHDVVSTIEKRTGLVSDLREVKGGLFVEDPDWEWSHFFLPEDYDQRSPLEQWLSQQPVGYQTVFQLLNTEEKMDLSSENIKNAVQGTLSKMKSVTSKESEDMAKAEFHEVGSIGDGYVIAALWSGGNCVALWDGRDHVDLNLFTFNESEELANEFAILFNSHFPNELTMALRDAQPRGFGRVVNFAKDIGPRATPHWARFKE